MTTEVIVKVLKNKSWKFWERRFSCEVKINGKTRYYNTALTKTKLEKKMLNDLKWSLISYHDPMAAKIKKAISEFE